MKVAVVILNWNGVDMMRRFMPSVFENSKDEAVVYVADNCSTDNSIEMLEKEYPEVRIIRLEKNWGFAEGYNKALAQIDAEYYVLLNSDVEVTPGWLTPIIKFMDEHEDVAVCQPKLLSYFHKNQFEYAGAAGGFIDKFGYPFCRGRLFDVVEEDKGQYDSRMELFWATGACLFIRSADYNNVGGLDGRFFAHCEEIDMCWRLRLLGRKIYCIPESVVYHWGGGTLPKTNSRKTFLNFRNNLTMLYKNLPDNELKKVMRYRFFMDYLAAFATLLLNRNIEDFKAIYRARKAFSEWKKDFEKDRHNIQSSAVLKSIPQRYNISVVWKYHIKGIKQFSKL